VSIRGRSTVDPGSIWCLYRVDLVSILVRMVDPVPIQARSGAEPRSIQCRCRFDLVYIQSRSGVVPDSVWRRPKVDPNSIQIRSGVEPMSIRCRPWFDLVPTQGRSMVDPWPIVLCWGVPRVHGRSFVVLAQNRMQSDVHRHSAHGLAHATPLGFGFPPRMCIIYILHTACSAH
jgi:hypothetical protein